jgi:amidase
MTSLADETRWLDATAQAALVRSGQVHPRELLTAAVERAERLDPMLSALTSTWFDEALQAASTDGGLADGPFHGVPFLLKDLYAAFAGQPLSNGNRALKAAGYRASADTTLVSRYRAAGLNIMGRTNSPEWGSVPTTEPLAWGPTHNPWDLTRSPGGSSGGSAAAVAAGIVPFAHASDGGGSIRIPASCCGLVGLKVSQGRITLGPLRDESGLGVEHCVSRTVRDTAALLDATRGPGVGDTVIAPAPARPYLDEVGADPGRLRVGVLTVNPRGGAVDDECSRAAQRTGELLASLGHHVEPAWPEVLSDQELPGRFTALWATNMAVAVDRTSAMLEREIGPDDVELVNWTMAMYAREMTAVQYAEALAAVVTFRRRLQQWWADGWDLLVTPTLAAPPVPLGTIVNDPANPMLPMTLSGQWVPFTPPYNTSGQPAISLPMHWTPEGLPVGVQLVAAYGREDVLICVAAQLESAAPWDHHRPLE